MNSIHNKLAAPSSPQGGGPRQGGGRKSRKTLVSVFLLE